MHKRKRIVFSISIVLFAWYLFCLPAHLFKDPYSTVIEDDKGNLMGAKIATDGQWRFPMQDTVPEKFAKCIVHFEDRHFYHHPGVNPVSIVRAFSKNIKQRKIVQGGSTISMQVIRISRKGKKRNVWQKVIEMVQATRLELKYSKNEILAYYTANAPFGGNVVGLDAASWRYFGRSSNELSWAEAATLAVLPNAPSIIHPGKNRNTLQRKRDVLLDKLLKYNQIDSTTCYLAKLEPLPDKPVPLPMIAPHLLGRIYANNRGERIKTSINAHYQVRAAEIVEKHYQILRGNHVYNAAAIIMDIESNKVLAYIGNTTSDDMPEHSGYVDIANSPRSTGSILKPFLYAAMFDEGELLPNTLVKDIPTDISGYVPENYNHKFTGLVPAKTALAHSLNIPAVRLLRQHGLAKYHGMLKKMGMTTLYHHPDHYGLTLILGGAEARLWDLAGMYAGMARSLNHFVEEESTYSANDYRPPSYLLHAKTPEFKNEKDGLINAGAIYLTFEAMLEVKRPSALSNWKSFSSSQKISWKTGTSFGNRDAWAIGLTKKYLVAVWVGNADGTGRPGLTGIDGAAPLLFDLFAMLPKSQWFDIPYDDLWEVEICSKSGYRKSTICPDTEKAWVPRNGIRMQACPFERIIHLDHSGRYRVTSDCESPSQMQHDVWFVLPPATEWYYKTYNPLYKPLPPFKPGCQPVEKDSPIELIYPKNASQVYIPIDLSGKRSQVVFKAAHRSSDATLYWHFNKEFIGATSLEHKIGMSPATGRHTLTIVDDDGNILEKTITILDNTSN